MKNAIFAGVILLACLQICTSFNIILNKVAMRRSLAARASVSMNSIQDSLGLMPICLQATSKTTTINDPTAGMTPDQITDYVSNVGGGMCGYPEVVRTSIGVGLNLSLIAFGIFTVSYVILGGLNFFYEKQIEDTVKDADKSFGFTTNSPNLSSALSDAPGEIGLASSSSSSAAASSAAAANRDGTNRESRRLQQKLGKKDE